MKSKFIFAIIDCNSKAIIIFFFSALLLCSINISVSAQKGKNKAIDVVSGNPEYPDGNEACIKFIFDNIVFPDSLHTTKPYVEVFVNFIVEKDGSLTGIKIPTQSFEQLNEEIIRVFKLMPKWKPGTNKGKVKRSRYTYRVVISTGIQYAGEVYMFVEDMPSFTGGEKALRMFLNNNIDYPLLALENRVQGRVHVTFIVETDGSLSDLSILKGIGSGCDEETIRVVKLMPSWIPGMKDGVPVRVQYSLPVTFMLE